MSDDASTAPPAEVIRERLQQQLKVSDEAFDALLSPGPRARSRSYWSCVEACQTAAQLFREAGATRILDAGAGVGKFCTIASLALGQRVFGVERRPHLVREARALAERLGADVEVTQGTLHDIDPRGFDGFYFFNPFGEYVADDEDRYDSFAPKSFDAYVRDARLVEGWLRGAPLGTALVTYNGLGGRIPVSFRPVETTHVRADTLRLWTKQHADTSTDAFIELEEELITASELAELAASGDLEDNPLVLELSRYVAAPQADAPRPG